MNNKNKVKENKFMVNVKKRLILSPSLILSSMLFLFLFLILIPKNGAAIDNSQTETNNTINSSSNMSGSMQDNIAAADIVPDSAQSLQTIQDSQESNAEQIGIIEQALSEDKFSRASQYYQDELPKVINSRNEETQVKTLFYKTGSDKLENTRLQNIKSLMISRGISDVVAGDASGQTSDLQTTKAPLLPQIDTIHPAENTKVDTEMLIVAPEEQDNKILKINNLSYKKNMTIGVDELSMDSNYIENSKEVESYAINLDGLNFTEGRLTAIAKGNLLWKCAAWNFTEQSCEGSWQLIQEIMPGQEYNITLFPGDPGYIETYDYNQSLDVAMTALDENTIVIAWINNDTNYYASFEVWNTNGTLLVSQVDFETSGSATSRVDVEAINSTHFVLGLIDGPDQDQDFFIYNRTGGMVLGVTQLDATIGAIADVAICELGDRFAIINENTADADADFFIRANNGNSLVAQTAVDGTTTPEANGQNLVDCVALNATKWAYFLFDDPTNDASVAIVNGSGSILAAENDLDADVGETAQIAGAGLGNNRFAAVFYDATDDDITINITQVSATNTFTPIYYGDIDTDAGTDSRVAAVEVRNSNESYFVAAWQDSTTGDIKAGVYNRTGGVVTAPFTITTTETASYKLLDVAGYNSVLGRGLCNYTFAIAYTNASMTSVFETYWINGTRWDGRCPEYNPPDITIIAPPNNTMNKSTSVITFYYNVSDESYIENCTIYINSTLNSTNITVTPNATSNFTLNLSNANYSWKIGCFDEFGNARNSSLYRLNVSWYIPVIQKLNVEPLITLNAGAVKKVDCNATIYEGNGYTDIANVNGTLYRINMSENGADDNNTHYTNASCAKISSAGNTSNYTCSFYAYYYAANGTWNCSVNAFDADNWNATHENSTVVDTLYALNLSAVILNYGDVSSGSVSSDKTMDITNYGNMPLNVTVQGYGGDVPATGNGYALRCLSGDNVTIDNERYSIISGMTFAQKTQLTSTAKHLNFTMQKQTLPNNLKINSTYWQLNVPPMAAVTRCNGTVVFTAAAP
jgi:hypothetical protein